MTVLSHTRSLNHLVVGEVYPTVISCDMALYEKVVKIIDSNASMKSQIIPRLGELHVVMAALRALGASIENSGIDEAWLEADVYGPATTRQILKCTNYKRCISAHIYTYTALYELAIAEFFAEKPNVEKVCTESAMPIQVACSDSDKGERANNVKDATCTMRQVLADNRIQEQFEVWERKRSENAMFKSMMNYLHRVEVILHFIAASRNADLQLHLEAGEKLSSLFFAMDRITETGQEAAAFLLPLEASGTSLVRDSLCQTPLRRTPLLGRFSSDQVLVTAIPGYDYQRFWPQLSESSQTIRIPVSTGFLGVCTPQRWIWIPGLTGIAYLLSQNSSGLVWDGCACPSGYVRGCFAYL